jgi:hypothetical protein
LPIAARIWASAVIYTLGRVNFLSDPSQTPHLPTESLARLLGVKQTTMAAKGRVVMDLLGLDHFGTEFCLPSRLASHPTAWLVTIGGLLYDARTLPPQIQAELGQPLHCYRRRRGHVIGHEPQPRQRAQLDRCPQYVTRATELAHEHLIHRREGEVPDRLDPIDLREAPKLAQLLLGEHVTSRHPRHPPTQ